MPLLARIRERLGPLLPVGFRSYVARRLGSHRAFVGPSDRYDIAGASQFNLLTLLGLREHHYLLDVGCGSLRGGRLFIAYLQPGHYFGIEPEPWLVESAIRGELGRDMVLLKRPTFDHNAAFRLSVFGRAFDFIVASSIFSHASPAQIRACLAEARRVMGADSMLLASFVLGSSNYDGDVWVYPGTVTYTLDGVREMAEEQGLSCEPVDWPYVYGDGAQTWVAFTPAAAVPA